MASDMRTWIGLTQLKESTTVEFIEKFVRILEDIVDRISWGS